MTHATGVEAEERLMLYRNQMGLNSQDTEDGKISDRLG